MEQGGLAFRGAACRSSQVFDITDEIRAGRENMTLTVAITKTWRKRRIRGLADVSSQSNDKVQTNEARLAT